jgi:LPXTG-site transpeptidase (sortase) family protein
VDVVITDANGNTQTVTTNASGNWTATVPPGTTTADVDEADPDFPAGYTQTEGDDPTTVTAVAGANVSAGNDGYQLQSAVISNFVWNDINGDGFQDGGLEVGLDGVRVYIDSDNNNAYDAGEPTAVTAGGGLYSIGGLAGGTYNVRIDTATLPAGFNPTYDLDGGNDNEASVTLGAGQVRDDVDFGYQQQNAVISNFIWDDANGDGLQTGETGISGVRVFIDLDGDNTYDVGEPTDVTDGNGFYSIGNLAAGTYSVLVATSSLPAGGYIPTYDLDGVLDNETSVTVTPGQIRDDVDFGYQPQTPGIQVTKTITAVTFDTPQLIRMTYSILVENTGNVALSNIQVTDDLAAAFNLAASFNIASVVSGTFTTNPNFDGDTDVNLLAGTDSLAVGASGTITLVVLVDTGGNPDIYTNTADAQGTPPSGPDVTDSDSIPGPNFIDPAVTKAVNPSQAAVGDVVTFTIRVFNNGNVGATGVVVTDTIPDNLDYISATSIDTATSLPRGTVTLIPPRTVQVNIGALGVTDVIEITIVTRVNSPGQPPIQNVVTLIADPPPVGVSPDPTQNNTSAVVLQVGAPPGGGGGLGGVRSLPATGFAPDKITTLPAQTADQVYADLGDLWLEIPNLGIKTSIVGVPRSGDAWDVDWLWDQAGWLQGSAFPTWQGNSVVTGHVYLPNGKPGPFIDLSKLRWGNQIIVHAFGQRHTYEVRTNHIVMPNDLSALKHEEKAWLTLLTCKGYDESSDTYRYRIETRAVLIKVEPER